MKITKPLAGILAFLIVLFTMPLGHVAMILMEKGIGKDYLYHSAMLMGFVGFLFLIWGFFLKHETRASFAGLFAGLFIWTGWVEFAFVYYANRFDVAPLMVDGEVVTKPEYLIMPSSLPFLVIFLIYYFMGTKTGCTLFSWVQKKMNVKEIIEYKINNRNVALTTMMECIMLLWTFYIILLFAYDENFLGDRHPITYFIAFASLFCSVYLFRKLLKINNLGYAIRYALPVVIIFWNFVEILGRWDVMTEIWVEPFKHWVEILLLTIVFILLVVIGLIERKKSKIDSSSTLAIQ
ncbi:hypothetical protein EMN47_16360 [Prolixibacteraceae bacterium JC049]|nr:hypothetical protein [Prolixibacteraceae bacterium JC049]